MGQFEYKRENCDEGQLATLLMKYGSEGFRLVSSHYHPEHEFEPLLLIFERAKPASFENCDEVVKHESVSMHISHKNAKGWRLIAAVNITEESDDDFLYRLFFERQAG